MRLRSFLSILAAAGLPAACQAPPVAPLTAGERFAQVEILVES